MILIDLDATDDRPIHAWAVRENLAILPANQKAEDYIFPIPKPKPSP